MTERQNGHDPLDLLTISDLCQLLKVSRYWIYEQIEAGALPAIRIGSRAWRFTRADIERYVQGHRAA